MSPSGAPLADSQGAPTAPPTASALTGVLARCTRSFAPSAELKPLSRSVLAAIVLFTAATASADRVADQAAADATKPMNLRALIRHQAKQ